MYVIWIYSRVQTIRTTFLRLKAVQKELNWLERLVLAYFWTSAVMMLCGNSLKLQKSFSIPYKLPRLLVLVPPVVQN